MKKKCSKHSNGKLLAESKEKTSGILPKNIYLKSQYTHSFPLTLTSINPPYPKL